METLLIKGCSLPELEAWVESIGERRFRARQIFKHVYGRRIAKWDECTDLGRMFRVQLDFGTRLNALSFQEKQESSDGTVKYRFGLQDGHSIETVLIPDPPRYTLCVSSQVGCALGCAFCLTATMGLKRNLNTAEIVDQVCQVQRDTEQRNHISNIVFMGMGEPLANYDAVLKAIGILTDPNGLAFSHRRITLSTAGLVPQMIKLGDQSPVNLAVSLHASSDAVRDSIMPVNRTYPLPVLMEACRRYPLAPRKRITFEYILIDRVNDSTEDARALVKLLDGIRAKVNLIPLNPRPQCALRRPSQERMLAFQEVLQKAHLTAMIRQSRGADISAACGQLAVPHDDSPSADAPAKGKTSRKTACMENCLSVPVDGQKRFGQKDD
ncbi:MAG: 23S rRNA (adenine(2503)-C(2))-methyltransferase RlmN [Deltaproteobacteria bacterium]|nr:23S rRNA (adenine(2503)-C(2))-methyltransferase RlmN [Deltaproteobacteria bacterium]